MNWTPDALDRLERAIDAGSRVRLHRRGTEFVVVPQGLRMDYGGEVLTARHTGTGDRLEFGLAEIEAFAVLD
ncbi:MAG TPA: hypothetical protein VFX98_08200 [Longimicrobiaceae bacterium]|nr:hypothetical protein [Longimicrobiaceae bacterium]